MQNLIWALSGMPAVFIIIKFRIKYLAHEALEDSRTCGLVVNLAAQKVKARNVEELLKKCGLKMEKL